MTHHGQEAVVDLSEKGRSKNGDIISLNKRLYMQFQAFGNCTNISAVINALRDSTIESALYLDINDPYGVGLLTFNEDPSFFVSGVRELFNQSPFNQLTHKPEFTMLGRTYTLGYENDLEETLLDRPRRKVLNPDLKWVVWYPLQRKKDFELLPQEEQRKVLMEHGGIGMTYGKAGLATDIRLACHGLDKYDNDFVVGVLGGELHPLSKVVERMRKTQQTAKHLANLGPFFIGKVVWQSPA